MILGGFLYFTPKPNISKAKKYFLEIIGFILVISSLSIQLKNTMVKFYTLVPTIGTALILYVQNQESILTNNKLAQFLGTSSYSIYLWHWPIVFWMFHKGQQNNILFITLGILTSVLLGYLSGKILKIYWKQVKRKNHFKTKLNYYILLCINSCDICCCFLNTRS